MGLLDPLFGRKKEASPAAHQSSQSPTYVIVTPQEAARSPYPYVYVNADRTIRELHEDERKYLEERFSPFDGGRPYVKDGFETLDGWGSIQGFCHRSKVPHDLPVAPAPPENPNAPKSKAKQIEWLKTHMTGFQVIENPDGTVQMKRIAANDQDPRHP